ncbi:sensor histidine kinase [Propionicicella superfundia]|uniref:sensor histidine kinase n=1 Tax=Propionicicella superfundia TaxID=348582 RepID=UPI000412B257|nr:HAMP domain-containing sensor histidine kinase [Propionicicella superfundia]
MSDDLRDPDRLAVRAAARRVGGYLAVTTGVLVLITLAAMVVFVLRHAHESPREPGGSIEVEVSDLLAAAVAIGGCAVVIAAFASWSATRRAVAPLAESLRLQRRFVSDAGHELRTPIAVLDTRLQLLQRRLPPEDPTAATVETLRRETQSLSAIVTDLLAIAEADAPTTHGSSRVVDVVTATVESLDVLARSRDVAITVAGMVDARVALPAIALQRALTALLDNAVKHAPPGTEVTVSIETGRRDVRIAVRDRGPGVRGIDPDRVFDRFARGSEEAARSGHGIGLSLVRDTADRYGGSIRLVDADGPGAQFVLRLPRVLRPGGNPPRSYPPAAKLPGDR